MLTRTTAIAAVTAAVALGLATPAEATIVGVNGCSVTAVSNTSVTCAFIGTPGNYVLDLVSHARYAWAEASCAQGGRIYVNVWDYEGGYDWDLGYLKGGACTMVVSAGAGGDATAQVEQ